MAAPTRRTLPMATLAAFLLSGALASCGGADGGATPGLDGPDRILEWSRDVAWQAGGFEATDWDVFGRVSGVAFDGEGNLHILDGQANSVTVVNPEGEPIRSYGAEGEGPGELESPTGLAVFPDGSSAIWDFSKFGFVTYDPTGEWDGDVTWGREGTMMLLGEFAPTDGSTLFAERTGMIRMRQSNTAPDEGEPEPPGDPVVRIDLEAGTEPTIVFRAWEPPEPEGPEAEVSAATESGGSFRMRMGPLEAFSPDLLFAGLPGGRFAVVDSTTYTIEVRDREGELVREITRPISPIAVTETIREAERNRRLEELRAEEEEGRGGGAEIIVMGSRQGASIDPSAIRNAERERIENMVFYPEIPALDALAADWDGRIWATRGAEPDQDGPIDILTVEGEYVGTLPAGGLDVPDAFGPDGLVAWIERDDFDVQVITVARIVESAPTTE